MKKLLLILLCLPMIGFGQSQSKKELKNQNKYLLDRLFVRNDSIRIFLSKISHLENNINLLNSQLDNDKKAISELLAKNNKLNRKLDSISLLMNSKDNIDTVLVCALDLRLYKDTITESRWGYKYNTEKELMFYNCEPFTGISVSYFPDGKLEKVIGFKFGQESGVFNEWYHSGIMHKEGFYIQGTALTISWFGTWRIWYDNGQLATTWDGHSQSGSGGHVLPHSPMEWHCWDRQGEIIDCSQLELPNKETYILPEETYKN